MKILLFILVVFFTSIGALGQTWKPVTRQYLEAHERVNEANSSLMEMWSLIEYDSKYFSTRNAKLRYKDYLIFPGDMAYESTTNNQAIKITKSDFIFFQNIETQKIERVINLNDILKNAQIKQIWADRKMLKRGGSILEQLVRVNEHKKYIMPSIAITEDGRYLFFGTASNTYKYDLTTNEWSEVIIDGEYVALSPANGILEDNIIVFMIMKRIGKDGYTPVEDRYIEYNYVSKKFISKL